MNPKLYIAIFAIPLASVLMIVVALTIADSRSQTAHTVGATAEAALVSPDGSEIGTVTITQGPRGIIVATDVWGLSPGGHAISINSVGAWAPNFAPAGGDFSPHGNEHGFLQGDGPHVGDLPNIYVGDDGTARADFFAADITLDTGIDHSIFDADGSSIIIHQKPDTYGEGAGLGNRVACGVIRRN